MDEVNLSDTLDSRIEAIGRRHGVTVYASPNMQGMVFTIPDYTEWPLAMIEEVRQIANCRISDVEFFWEPKEQQQ